MSRVGRSPPTVVVAFLRCGHSSSKAPSERVGFSPDVAQFPSITRVYWFPRWTTVARYASHVHVTSTDSRVSLSIKTISQHGRPAMGSLISASGKPSVPTVKIDADVGTRNAASTRHGNTRSEAFLRLTSSRGLGHHHRNFAMDQPNASPYLTRRSRERPKRPQQDRDRTGRAK